MAKNKMGLLKPILKTVILFLVVFGVSTFFNTVGVTVANDLAVNQLNSSNEAFFEMTVYEGIRRNIGFLYVLLALILFSPEIIKGIRNKTTKVESKENEGDL